MFQPKANTISLADLIVLCGDLVLPESYEKIHERTTGVEGGLRAAARHYGASFASYSCHLLAGRLGYEDLLTNLEQKSRGDENLHGSSIIEYVDRAKHLLRPEIKSFMIDNVKLFQSLVSAADSAFSKSFDWLKYMSHETAYLMRSEFEGEVIESPALMHLRVTAELFYPRIADAALPGATVAESETRCDTKDEIAEALIFYELATKPYFTMASPVLFNSGHKAPNLCSCFLMTADDNLASIMGSMYKAALVSKAMGGVGLNIASLRHSPIGHAGMSRGIMPMLQMYDKLIRYVDQTGKRNGASTVFTQAHHIDLLPLIQSTPKNQTAEKRLDSLNTAILFPDLFWERLKENGPWTLFCPALFPRLNETYGEEYRALYLHYESMELDEKKDKYRIRKTALDIANALVDAQIMSGMPYVLHKDSINACSNQVNLASTNPLHHRVIQSSNLCLEIMEQTDAEEVACCNLGQLSLKAFVTIIDGLKRFDFSRFSYVVRVMVKFLDRVIDRNRYVFPEAKRSNLRHRPIGLGVSGYADMLDIMRISYESDEASALNRKIFACMYYNAMVASLELGIKYGPYSTFRGSPLSEGKFAFDLWHARRTQLTPKVIQPDPIQPAEWGQEQIYVEEGQFILNPSWDALRQAIMKHGVRNSQLLAIMPSASTSRLMGNAENTEAHQSNLYLRNFMKATAVIINPQLFAELDGEVGLWSRDVAEFIIAKGGSVAQLPQFLEATASDDDERAILEEKMPKLASICSRYKTMFEIKQKTVFSQIAARQTTICQGISANVYFDKPSRAMMRNFHIYTWEQGLKTGMYYLRESATAETPEYARTSQKVIQFLTGPPMPLLRSHHEPFPADQTPAETIARIRSIGRKETCGAVQRVEIIDITTPPSSQRETDKIVKSIVEVVETIDNADAAHGAFTALLAREDVELVSPEIALGQTMTGSEDGPACVRAPGCVGCGS